MNDQGSSNWLTNRAHQTMVENGFEPEFSAPVYDQLKKIEASGEPTADASFKDLRSLLWSSIDNATSRDLDQIEWAEALSNGDIRVLVGIADVDALVPVYSPIDIHAEQNTVTVYTESKIFPMLPEELSTGMTSLNADADRLAIVADMTVKENGDVPESIFYRAVVRNQWKLAYESVGEWLDNGGDPPDAVNRVAGLKEQIELQRQAERLAWDKNS